MKIKVFIKSEKRHYGANKIRNSKQTNLAVSKALKALGQRTKGQRSTKIEDHDSRGPLKYGTHNGSVHIHNIQTKEGTVDQIVDTVKSISSVINTFRNLTSIDLDEKKAQYSQRVDNVAKEYERKYGKNLPTSKSVEYTNRCAEFAFDYYRHQIVIQLIGTKDEFGPDAGLIPYGQDEEGNELYLFESKVKSVITNQLLTDETLESVCNGTDIYINAESKDIDFYCVLRTTSRGQKYIKVRRDNFDPTVDGLEDSSNYIY